MRFLATLLLCLSMAVPAAAQFTLGAQPAAEEPAAEATGAEELIRILENEESRNALIERLRAEEPAAGGTVETAAEAEAAAAAAEGTAEPTVARQIAEYTRGIAEAVSDSIAGLLAFAGELGSLAGTGGDGRLMQFGETLAHLAILGGVLFAAFLVARLVTGRIVAGLARRAAGGGWLKRGVCALLAAIADLAAVFVAWGIGYVIALQVMPGAFGRMQISQTLLLNAFLAVEISKVVLRLVLEPREGALRLWPMSDTSAGYWYFWFARVVSLLGYAFMFVGPVLADAVGPRMGSAVTVIAMFTAVIVGIVIVLQNKAPVRAALSKRYARGRHDALSRTLATLGAYWHIVAIFYLVAVLVVWLANPEEALPFMLAATVQSVLAIAAGSLVIAFVSRFLTGGVRLPDDVRQRLPLLETRLHAFVPRVLQVVRTIVLIAIVVAIAQAWSLIDFLGWAASETGQRVTGSVFAALVIVVVGFAVYLAVSSWVEYRLNPNFGTVPTAREKTLLSLFRNAFTIALLVFVAMSALAQIGVNIAPLLAGAGVLGLAIGFGAQKFVQDIITGIFIQLENIMNEGDVVNLGNFSGVVEKLTIRSVSIRSLDGTLHLIPFSSVDAVSNMMKGFSYHVAEIGVAYREDISEVKEAMNEAFGKLMQTDHAANILGPLEMQGITAFGDSAITVRARIKTKPGSQWAAGRSYNEFLKEVFDARGIEIPFPHVTLYMGEDKAGNAPPLHLQPDRAGRSEKPIIEGERTEPAAARS